MSHHAHGHGSDMANALRRYCYARAHGRPHPEYSRFEPSNRCWVASDEADAHGRCDGKHYRQEHRPGMEWCRWLGRDTTIAADHDLQAFFELHATEPHDWNRLLMEVSRNRRQALRDWQRKGREAVAHARVEEARAASAANGEDFEIVMTAVLAEEFRAPGRGMRSLKKA